MRTSKRSAGSLITWRQFGREGGSRVLEGRLTGWCNSRVRWRMPGSNVQALQGLTEGYFRLAPTHQAADLLDARSKLCRPDKEGQPEASGRETEISLCKALQCLDIAPRSTPRRHRALHGSSAACL